MRVIKKAIMRLGEGEPNLNQAFSGIEYLRGKIALLAGIFPARNIPENA
jgi:hypothetical protein